MLDKRKVKRFLAIKEKIEQLKEELKNIRSEQAPLCEHPKEFIYRCKWRHKPGEYTDGLVCKFCQSRQSFAEHGRWISLKEYFEDV